MSATQLSRVAVLKLSPSKLSRFPSDSPASLSDDRKSESAKIESADTPQLNESETSTPVPNADDAQKRRSLPGPKPGTKRSAPLDTDMSKPKGKPGPKRRKPDGENGPAPAAAPAQKLGPKANTGAINAHLRALDRTGKPCRKWNKKAIVLKTFTGVVWDLPYWQSPKTKSLLMEGEGQSETTGSSDAKIEPASSIVGSDADKDAIPSTTGPDVAASSPVSQQPLDVVTPS